MIDAVIFTPFALVADEPASIAPTCRPEPLSLAN